MYPSTGPCLVVLHVRICHCDASARRTRDQIVTKSIAVKNGKRLVSSGKHVLIHRRTIRVHVSRIYTGTLTNTVTRAATHTYAHTGGVTRGLTGQLADRQAHLAALHARLRTSWV